MDNAARRRERLKELYLLASETDPASREELLGSQGDLTSEEIDELRRLLALTGAESFFQTLGRAIGSLGVAEQALSPGDVLSDRFEIHRFLAAGGMGEVYAARDRELEIDVALKVLPGRLAWDESFIQRFRNEILLNRTISSANVCRVYDISRHRKAGTDVLFFTMELLEGQTLSAMLRESSPLHQDTVAALATQIAGGMRAAHDAGVLHLDLKSANVMVCEHRSQTRAVVMDFGIARSTLRAADADIAFTSASAAPEQIEQQPVTRATDVFAFGVLLYELLTGVLPFSGLSRESYLSPSRVRTDLPSRWDRIVAACLRTEPSARPQSFSEVLDLLNPEPPGLTRRRMFSLSAVGLGMCAGTGGYLALRPSQKGQLPAVAVLPFEADSGSSVAQTAGLLGDRLRDVFCRLPGVRVVAASVTARYLKDAPGIAAAAERMRTDFVVSGRIGGSDDSLRVHLELANAGGDVIWTRTRTGPAVELEPLYRDMALQLAAALKLDSRAAAAVPAEAGTRHPVAWQKYLLARYQTDASSLPVMHRSVELLEEAVALDPRFAAAHAWLGMCYHLLDGDDAESEARLYAKAIGSAQQALRLDPRCADAHTVLGICDEFWNWDWTGAEMHYRRAVELAPADAFPHLRYARMLREVLRVSDALAEIETAARLDFDSADIPLSRGRILLTARRPAEALECFESVLRIEPSKVYVHVLLSDALIALGRLPEALNAAHEAVVKSASVDGSGQPRAFTVAQEGYVLGLLGRRDEALVRLDRLEQLWREKRVDAGEAAEIPAGLRDVELTLMWLQRAVQTHSHALISLLADDLWRFLDGNAEFEQILRLVRLKT